MVMVQESAHTMGNVNSIQVRKRCFIGPEPDSCKPVRKPNPLVGPTASATQSGNLNAVLDPIENARHVGEASGFRAVSFVRTLLLLPAPACLGYQIARLDTRLDTIRFVTFCCACRVF